MPVLLLAAIHFLVLDHALAAWYPNITGDFRSPDDPALVQVLHGFVACRAFVEE